MIGELSLDGAVRHVHGHHLPMVALAAQSRDAARVRAVAMMRDEAALIDGIEVYPVDTLAGLVRHLNGEAPIPSIAGKPADEDDDRATTGHRFRRRAAGRSRSSAGWRSRRLVDITF